MKDIEFENIRVKMPELRIWFGDREIFPSLLQMRLLLIFLSDPYRTFGSKGLQLRLQLSSHEALIALVHRLRLMLDRKYIVTEQWGYVFAKESRSQKGSDT